MKLTSKLTLLVFIASSVPLCLASLYFFADIESLILRKEVERLEAIATAQEARIENEIEHYRDEHLLIGSRTALRSKLARHLEQPSQQLVYEMSSILSDAKQSVSEIEKISILSQDGKILASTDSTAIGKTFDTKAHLEYAEEKELIVDADCSKEQDLLEIFGPIELGGKFLGILAIERRGRSLVSTLADYSGLGDSGETMLAKRTKDGGAEFIHLIRFEDQFDDMELVVPPSALHVPITYALQKKEIALGTEKESPIVDYRGVPVIAVTRYIPEADWGLVVKIDRAEVYSVFRQHAFAILQICLLGVTLACLVCIVASRTLVGGLLALRNFMPGVTQGELSQRLELNTNDEVADVAHSVNNMLDELESTLVSRERLRDEVSRRIEIEEKLRQSQETYRELFNSSLLGIIIANTDQQILMFSPKAEEIFLTTSEQAQRKMVSELIQHEIFQNDKMEEYLNTSDPSTATPTKAIGLRENHETFALEFQINSLKVNKEIQFYVFVRDISEEVEMKEYLERADFLESLGKISSGIAHEINSPLLEMCLTAERIQRIAGRGDTAELRSAANSIVESSENVSSLIESLKHLSRKARRDDLKLESLDEILNDIFRLSKMKFELANITLTINKLTQCDTNMVKCVRSDVNQILLNLLNNAFDAVEGSDSAQVKIESRSLGEQIEVLISDSGPGVEPKLREQIFDLFFTTKPVGSGTGLGLGICVALAQRNGLQLFLEDKEPLSTFVLRFPMCYNDRSSVI